MAVKFSNNGYGTISGAISATDVVIALTSGNGSRFPAISGGDYFFATLIDTANNLEIIKVTNRIDDTLYVVRGQDNTTARSFASGDRIEHRWCVAAVEAIRAEAAGSMNAGFHHALSNSILSSYNLFP
jgi:hypothetical protein